MAVLASNVLTLADWAKRLDDNYKTATIVEMLSQTNEILADAMFMEGNLPTGHKTTVRTGLPSATWRLLNYGVPKGKSTTAQIIDTCGNLETFSEVDKDLADLAGNTSEFRASESVAFLEGMSQQVASTMIYGNTAANPERFTGLAPRYNTVNTSNAQSANNVIDAGGTGSDNTSIWIVVWGANTVHGIFPKGKATGLRHTDMGVWPVTDVNGGLYMAYRDHYKWELGLTVRDWRYAVRIANIDVSDLATGSAANLANLLVRGLNRLPTTAGTATSITTSDAPSISGGMGKAAIYCNRTVRTYLELQAMNKTNVWLSLQEFDGRVIPAFRGIPIRNVDAILNTEARVV